MNQVKFFPLDQIPGNPQNPGNEEDLLQKCMLELTIAYHHTQKEDYFGSLQLSRLIISILTDSRFPPLPP